MPSVSSASAVHATPKVQASLEGLPSELLATVADAVLQPVVKNRRATLINLALIARRMAEVVMGAPKLALAKAFAEAAGTPEPFWPQEKWLELKDDAAFLGGAAHEDYDAAGRGAFEAALERWKVHGELFHTTIAKQRRIATSRMV